MCVSGTRLRRRTTVLFHQLDLAWQPPPFVPGLRRAVETQKAEPALTLHGLDPVCLLALGRLGAEIEGVRPVIVVDQRIFVGRGALARVSEG